MSNLNNNTTSTDRHDTIEEVIGRPEIDDKTLFVQMGSDPEQSDTRIFYGGRYWDFKAFSYENGIVWDKTVAFDRMPDYNITLYCGDETVLFGNGNHHYEDGGTEITVASGNEEWANLHLHTSIPYANKVCVSYECVDFLLDKDGNATVYKHDEDKKRINLLSTIAKYGDKFVAFGEHFHIEGIKDDE